jgi:hypothetical protein
MICYNCKENLGLLYYSSEDFNDTLNELYVCSRLCYIEVDKLNRKTILLSKVTALIVPNSVLLLLIFLFQVSPFYFIGEALVNMYLLYMIFSLRKFETYVSNLDQDLFNDYKDIEYNKLRNEIKTYPVQQRFDFRKKQHYLLYVYFYLCLGLIFSLVLITLDIIILLLILILITSLNFILYILIIFPDFIDHNYIQTEHMLPTSLAFVLMNFYLIKLKLIIGFETYRFLSDLFFLPLIFCYVLYFWYLRKWKISS